SRRRRSPAGTTVRSTTRRSPPAAAATPSAADDRAGGSGGVAPAHCLDTPVGALRLVRVGPLGETLAQVNPQASLSLDEVLVAPVALQGFHAPPDGATGAHVVSHPRPPTSPVVWIPGP